MVLWRIIMSHPDNERFEMIKNRILNVSRGNTGIGSLSEKSVHAVLKSYYAPNDDMIEVAINGFVADVCFDRNIYEIQTRQFYTMKRKLDAFLPEFDVTIVYPLPVKKTILRVDPDSGHITSRRVSPRKPGIYDVFYELYGIRDYLKNRHLHIKITSLEIEDIRFTGLTEQHGRRKRPLSDLVPVRILDETDIMDIRDMMMFVPPQLNEEFTCSEFARAAGIGTELARYVTGLLRITGILERNGRKGREYLYQVNESADLPE